MPWVLPQLDIAVAFLVALGFCLLVAYVARALFGTAAGAVGWIPFVGKVVARSLLDVEHKITSIMGKAAAALETRIGASWHSTARLFDHLGREIASHGNLIGQLAEMLPGADVIVTTIRALRALQHRAHAIEQAIGRLGHDVLPRVKVIERGIGADVLPRIKGLERDLNRELTRDIPGLRAGERLLEREITNLWKWTRAHTLVAGSIAFAGAVALALTRLGLGWVRCSKVGRTGRNVCGMDASLLESLLADTLLVAGSLSLVTFAEEMQGVTETAVRPITSFWRAS